MKYFLDFEATQFSNEIIAIGCVNENNQTFYSLVKPKKKITDFITSLTGITNEMLEDAPSSDKAFSAFYDWLNHNEPAEFYCYGNCDIDFVKKNLYANTKTFKAQAALSMIATNLTDYAINVRKHFGLVDCIGLVKVVAYYRNLLTPFKQRHNALEDALFLKEVYDGISNESEINGDPFPTYTKVADVQTDVVSSSATIYKNCTVHKMKHGKILESFDTMAAAVEYALTLIPDKDREVAGKNKNRIACRIAKSAKNKEKYLGYKWNVKY